MNRAATSKAKQHAAFISYRVWCIVGLVIWICLALLYGNSRPLRREKLRLGMTWESCEVALMQIDYGRDTCRYLHLDEIAEFETTGDGWMLFSDGIEDAGIIPDTVLLRYWDLPLMNLLACVDHGMVYFKDETPYFSDGIGNFTLAVYDTAACTLYYIEYNS